MMQNLRPLLPLVILTFILVPSQLNARQNSLTTGLGVSFDYTERVYDTFVDDPDTEADESDITLRGEDDYKWFVVTPLLQFTSTDVRDNFEIRIAPDIRYDLIEYDTGWFSDFFVSADRYITRTWQLEVSNSYIISDYYGTDDPGAVTVTELPTAATSTAQLSNPDPELSPDIGRTKYWRNALRLASNHTYKEDSLFRVGFDYIVLREDEDDDVLGGVDDYDRYALNFVNEHQFSNIWSSTVDLLFVQGDFEETDPEVADAVIEEIAPESDIIIDDSDLSNDLKEYHVLLSVDNASIIHNLFSLSYNYIGGRYDEILRNDGDIHQGTLTWRHDYSPQLYTRLGAGPSYEKTENRDENWDWNGIAELNYTIQRGNIGLLVEKGYTVDSFSGTDERGFVDFWDASFNVTYDLTQYLRLRAELGYLFEERTDPLVAVGRLVAAGDQVSDLEEGDIEELEQYERDRYRAGLGLSYNFWRNFTASGDYFYIKQESDRFNDDYDDHRILLTISWANEVFRW